MEKGNARARRSAAMGGWPKAQRGRPMASTGTRVRGGRVAAHLGEVDGKERMSLRPGSKG